MIGHLMSQKETQTKVDKKVAIRIHNNLIAKFQGCCCSICLQLSDECITISVATSVGGRSLFERIKSVSRVAAPARFTMAISRHTIAKWHENS